MLSCGAAALENSVEDERMGGWCRGKGVIVVMVVVVDPVEEGRKEERKMEESGSG